MSSVAMSRTQAVRPPTVLAAITLTVFSAIVGNVVALVGGPEGASVAAVVIGGVSAALHLLGAWGMWNLRRWGPIFTFVLTVLDVVASIPLAIGDASDKPQSDWFTAAAVFFILVGIAVLVLIALPASRRAFRRTT